MAVEILVRRAHPCAHPVHHITPVACSAPHSLRSLAVLGLRHICPAPARKLAYSAQAKRQVTGKRYLSKTVYFVERYNDREEKIKIESPDKNSFVIFDREYNDKGDLILTRRLEVSKAKTNEAETDRYEYEYR